MGLWRFCPGSARSNADLRMTDVQPILAAARDHMNPRSTSQPAESDSRRLPPAVIALLGWTAARFGFVTVMPA